MSGVVRTQLSDNYHHALYLMSALTRSASALVLCEQITAAPSFHVCRERDTSENQVTRQEEKSDYNQELYRESLVYLPVIEII